MLSTLSTGLGIFLAAAFFIPIEKRYREWKASPERPIVARRNWRGTYVPDLSLIRFERAMSLLQWGGLALGLAFMMTIMGVRI